MADLDTKALSRAVIARQAEQQATAGTRQQAAARECPCQPQISEELGPEVELGHAGDEETLPWGAVENSLWEGHDQEDDATQKLETQSFDIASIKRDAE